MRAYCGLKTKLKHFKRQLLYALKTLVIDCDVTMGEVYQAKYPFRGLQDCGVYGIKPTKSTSNLTSPTKSLNGNNNGITRDEWTKLTKCFTKMASDAFLTSPVLSAKLEKCNSEPNVSKETGSADDESKRSKCSSSPCQTSQSEHSLAGISTPGLRESQRKLFLPFDEGDTFEVLSKEEHASWWVVRALKTDSVGFVPASLLNHAAEGVTCGSSSQDKREANLRAVADLRRRIAGTAGQGEFFPSNMIPEPELCTSGGDLEKRNRHNNAAPVAPPLPPHNPEGIIVPRKPQNPCVESTDHKNLHRELLFNQKIGKNVLNQKSELQRALEKHKEHQVKKELEQQKQESKSALERVIEERAKRLETLQKTEEDNKPCRPGEPEFMKIHARLRARMDSK